MFPIHNTIDPFSLSSKSIPSSKWYAWCTQIKILNIKKSVGVSCVFVFDVCAFFGSTCVHVQRVFVYRSNMMHFYYLSHWCETTNVLQFRWGGEREKREF